MCANWDTNTNSIATQEHEQYDHLRGEFNQKKNSFLFIV